MRADIVPNGNGILQIGRIHAPHLCVSVFGYYGHILHHPAHTRLVAVQQHRLTYRIRSTEQFPGDRSRYHNSGHITAPVRIIESASGDELHPEHFPETRIRLHGIHLYAVSAIGHGNQSNSRRNKCRTSLHFRQRLHALFHKSRRTGAIIIPLLISFALQMHLTYI